MKIVVVDDEPDARELARMVLERGGHEVHTARHPDEALQVLAQQAIDVVLTDLHMPRMDGEQLAEMIATVHPEVTCIIWSTAGENGTNVHPKDVMRLEIEEWVDGDAHEPSAAGPTSAASGATTGDDA